MEHSTQLLKDLESAITKTHEGILDLLHAIGKIHTCETEYVHTVDGLAEVEATAQEEAPAVATPEPETPSAQTTAANEGPAQPQEAQDPEPVNDAPEEPAPAAAVYKLEDARAELAKLTRAGRADEARKILASFNAHKLSEVSEERYGDVIKAVKDIA
ncbi:hypothetical protein [Corynebacterium minutissimum]|uniref:hypothetical protein n=1 Tax=Corynebacterium minutissimum TaxID=38301 RepID=UPI001EF1F4F3|nr:hypothetical protein [Corynebacterium minutissimum]MCG7239597.1 hypothetical protein [Corynebacterium minutissimum]